MALREQSVQGESQAEQVPRSHLLGAPTSLWEPTWSRLPRPVLGHATLRSLHHRASIARGGPWTELREAQHRKPEPLVPDTETQKLRRVLPATVKFLSTSGDPEPGSLFEFEVASHVTESVAASLKVWVSRGFPGKLCLVPGGGAASAANV